MLTTLEAWTAYQYCSPAPARDPLSGPGTDPANDPLSTPVLTPTPEDEQPTVLYHYTDEEGYKGILKDNHIRASFGEGHAAFGSGQYFTDISDAEAATRSPYQLSRAIMKTPWWHKKVMYVFAIDVQDLSINLEAPTFSNTYGNKYIYRHPSTMPLDLSGRLLRHGKVPYQGK